MKSENFNPDVLVRLGAVGVLFVCLFYILSPPIAVLPFHNYDTAKALQASFDGKATMFLAGIFGVFGDLFLVVGCFGQSRITKNSKEVLGWIWLAISNFLFLFADILVGFVLPADWQNGQIYQPFRGFFNILFTSGILCFGFALLFIFADKIKSSLINRGVAVVSLILGGISLISASLFFFGFETGKLMGLIIAPVCLLFIFSKLPYTDSQTLV